MHDFRSDSLSAFPRDISLALDLPVKDPSDVGMMFLQQVQNALLRSLAVRIPLTFLFDCFDVKLWLRRD